MANKGNLKPFKKGYDERRNLKGNKGSKWRSTLLKDLLTADLSKTEIEQFNEFEEKFPSLFGDDKDKNFQLFMEMKQLSLVFHKSPKVAQDAIKEIKDRIDGRAKQTINQEIKTHTPKPDLSNLTEEELKVLEKITYDDTND